MKKTDTQIQTPTKRRLNYAKEPNEAHKNYLKDKILQVINENFIEMILDKVNQNVWRYSRNSKTTKIENLRKHKKKQKKP
jgi:hypothetical protein